MTVSDGYAESIAPRMPAVQTIVYLDSRGNPHTLHFAGTPVIDDLLAVVRSAKARSVRYDDPPPVRLVT